MINEAEKYKDEDNLHKQKIEAKNNLESLLYQSKTSVENEEIKSKLEESEIQKVKDKVTEVETWILEERTKEEYENKLNEVNSELNPIMMKIYSEGAGGAEMPVPPAGVATDQADMPTIDEID
jgi:L1 cell adhesion molecule like protein